MGLTWSNFLGNQVIAADRVTAPMRVAELQDLVRLAATNGKRIRVAGAGHSVTPLCLSPDIVVSTYSLAHPIVVHDDMEVTVPAGVLVRDVSQQLWEQGFSLFDQGDTAAQTLVGAFATGTHGGGMSLPILSTYATSFELVTASGDIEVIDSGSTSAIGLDAVRVSLGLLGIVTKVRVKVQPRRWLRERVDVMPFAAFVEAHDDLMSAARHVSVFWLPDAVAGAAFGLPDQEPDTVLVRSVSPVETDETAEAGPFSGRVAPAHRILSMAPDPHPPNYLEMEYFVDRREGLATFSAVRDHALTLGAKVTLPVEYRWVAADEALLSPAHRRDSAIVSVATDPQGDQEFHRVCEAVFTDVAGRPHWGKVHTLTRDRLAAVYPAYERFAAIRAAADPTGLFLNEHLEELFG